MSEITLHWHLQALMAQRGYRSTASLHRALEARGVLISKVQLARTVKELPVRLNTHLLLVLCTLLECAPAQLLSLEQLEPANRRRKATGRKERMAATVTDISQLIGPSFRLRRTIIGDNGD